MMIMFKSGNQATGAACMPETTNRQGLSFPPAATVHPCESSCRSFFSWILYLKTLTPSRQSTGISVP